MSSETISLLIVFVPVIVGMGLYLRGVSQIDLTLPSWRIWLGVWSWLGIYILIVCISVALAELYSATHIAY
jgi:hypothetical protein